ncbi:MAG: hypothetical protein MJ003_06920 [Paludibacteraceae bacterium]|nr:hypothetical protein [Paludibacteraceae bacterium]
MKNLLILCDAFPPAFAPRMGGLCKYIQEYGWNVYVISEKQKNVGNISDVNPLRLELLNYYTKDNKFHWLCKFILDFLFHSKDREVINIFKQKYSDVKFDAILCSTYMLFPMYAASKISEMKNIPLVYDMRDVMEQFTGYEYALHRLFKNEKLNNLVHKIRNKKIRRERNYLLRKHNVVSTVSPWHVKLMKSLDVENVQLIYNGYDPQVFKPQVIKTDKFIIQYTGRILDSKLYDAGLLCEALQKLDNEGKILQENFSVNWNIDEKSAVIIRKLFSEFGVEKFLKIDNFVPQSEVPALLNESSIVLVLTNKMDEKGPKGIMTTKFFEALAVKKPILCVRSDEAYLEALINKTKCGIAARRVEEVEDFIMKQYKVWEKEHYITIDSDEALVKQFSRKFQASQFNDLLNSIIK